jgi:superoxide dismutase
MSEDKLLKARVDAGHAKALLDDEMLKTAFDGLKQAYIEKLISTTEDQSGARERLYLSVKAVGEVQRHLQAILDSGKLADAELHRLISMGQPKKAWNQV